MGSLKDFKYKVIDSFLTKEELSLLQIYCDIKHFHNDIEFDFSQNNNGDSSFYADPLIESLMVSKIPLMEKETNLKLHPTYSFWRMYTYKANLAKHKDRPSCEISVTVQINGNGEWPIFMDGTSVTLKNGQAVAYYGTEVEHWRESLNSDFQAQAFLHYVDQNGPYKEFKFDKRNNLGDKK